MRRTIVVIAFSLLGVLVLVAPWPGAAISRGAREIHVRASQYAYTPGVLRVSQGDRVTLVLEAEDVTHGLYVDTYDVDLVAIPGRSGRTTFVADRPGRFQLRCSQVCGTLHPFMLGELIVEPNSPFWRAVGLAVLAAIGTVIFLRTSPRHASGGASV
jgi:heme/copper-type cytochrome/quinol oxidase subunit 2